MLVIANLVVAVSHKHYALRNESSLTTFKSCYTFTTVVHNPVGLWPNVSSVLTIEFDACFEALPFERSAKATTPFRRTIANILDFRIDDRRTIHAINNLPWNINYFSRIVNDICTFRSTLVATTIHRSKWATFVCVHICVIATIGNSPEIDILSEFKHLVAVDRPVCRNVPTNIGCADDCTNSLNLETLVTNRTCVGIYAGHTRCRRYRHRSESICSLVVVVCHINIQAVAEHTQIKSYLPRRHSFRQRCIVGLWIFNVYNTRE